MSLVPVERLALEMAVHEESERRALEGELTQLAQEWKDAEEIAAIADDMFIAPSVEARMKTLDGNAPGNTPDAPSR